MRRVLALPATLAAAALLTAGCGAGGPVPANADKARGKQLFQQKCGACHTLADAGTSGTIGPNLDDAFSGPRAQGFKESSIRSVVHGQILYPTTNPTGVIKGPGGVEHPVQGMPAKLVTGDDANDVAAYVASVAGLAAVGATTGATTTSAAPPPPQPTTTEATTTAPATTSATTTGGGASAAAGKQVFDANGCASCHTLKAAGATGKVGPDLDNLPAYAKQAGKPLPDFVKESIVDPNAYVQPGFPKGVMPPFSSLPTDKLDALVQFLIQSSSGG